MTKLLITNGYVIDPTRGVNAGKNVLIEDGRIVGLLDRSDAAPEDAETFDATACVVAPGFIDLHVHLREPGHEYKETIESGAIAAAAGGWTSICAMPNTDPVNDNAAVTRFIIEQAARARANGASCANVFPIGAITKGSKGTELAEMGEMRDAGIVAVSDDGHPVPNAGMMRRAMEYAQNFDLPVVDHCEDLSLSGGGVMHEGAWSLRLGLRGSPSLAEESDAARDVHLAELTGAQIHLCHVSTRGTLEIVRRAKGRGVRVTCEVTPHHFTLTDAAVEGYNTNMKMNPPLRTEDDLEAILEALRDGTIDAIATDHAPHHADEKALEFDHAPFGIIGLETALGLACDRLVHQGIIDLQRLVELCSVNPARIFKLEERGTLRPGSHADLTIFDPEQTWTVEPDKLKSQSRNTPFQNRTLRGKPIMTIINGRMRNAECGMRNADSRVKSKSPS